MLSQFQACPSPPPRHLPSCRDFVVTKSAICLVSVRSKGGAVVRALTSHQSDPGSNPGVDAICGLSLLLVLSFAPRGFSGYSAFPFSSKTSIFKFQFNSNSNSIPIPIQFQFKSGRRSLWMCFLQIVILFSLSELSSPADRLLFTWQGFFANCCQMLKICTTGMLLI